jgi:hypothetical protein
MGTAGYSMFLPAKSREGQNFPDPTIVVYRLAGPFRRSFTSRRSDRIC